VRPAESVEAKLSGLSAGLYAVSCSFHPTMDATQKVE
jgi:hypothetical protein